MLQEQKQSARPSAFMFRMHHNCRLLQQDIHGSIECTRRDPNARRIEKSVQKVMVEQLRV